MEKAKSAEKQYPSTGVYKHYKSTAEDKRYYKVLGSGRHTETEELVVVYVALYASSESSELGLWVRPLDKFMESVEHEGYIVPRFRYIGPEL